MQRKNSDSNRKRRPNPDEIKGLALDLDGTTLMPGAVLGERTAEVLKALMQRGIQMVLCTGRAVEAAERFRTALGAEGPMVYFNGAEVCDMPSGKVLDTTLLGIDTVDFCIDISRKYGAYFQVFFPPGEEAASGLSSSPDRFSRVLMAEKWGPETDMYLNHTGVVSKIGDLKEEIAAKRIKGCIKTMYIAEPEVQDRIRPFIEERFGGTIYIAKTLGTFLEIMDAKVSKGRGLRTALENRGLAASEVMAFGDEENDLPLFSEAAWSVAPANAKESVRKAADLVVGPNTEEGVAAFLEEFFALG
jgi:Cof subfamily protein (haloacid dehalogenase superfamily)